MGLSSTCRKGSLKVLCKSIKKVGRALYSYQSRRYDFAYNRRLFLGHFKGPGTLN